MKLIIFLICLWFASTVYILAALAFILGIARKYSIKVCDFADNTLLGLKPYSGITLKEIQSWKILRRFPDNTDIRINDAGELHVCQKGSFGIRIFKKKPGLPVYHFYINNLLNN